jgi:hypothetical protein
METQNCKFKAWTLSGKAPRVGEVLKKPQGKENRRKPWKTSAFIDLREGKRA